MSDYLTNEQLGELYQAYIKNIRYDIIFSLIKFNELSLLFDELGIIDIVISDFNTVRIDNIIVKKDRSRICQVFNKKESKELYSYILIMYRKSLDLFRTMSLNLRYAKKDGNDYILLHEEPKAEDKGYHFYTPTIAMYDLRIEINIVIKTLLQNGETVETLDNINMIYARYCFLQLRSHGI